MSMTQERLLGLGERQQDLLRELRREPQGLTVDELVERLGITRTAVNQHLKSLEERGCVARGTPRESGGRPSRPYLLTVRGLDLFPRRYSWFSSLLVAKIRDERGTESLSTLMRQMAKSIAASLKERMLGKSLPGRVRELEGIMEELGYEARAARLKSPFPVIEAQNCVYHAIAVENPEVCQFDLQLLEDLSGATVHHEECVIRGGRCCRFRFEEK